MLKCGSKDQAKIQGLILIDCWEPSEHHNEQKVFYQNLIQQIAKFDIRYVVSACYSSDLNIPAPLSRYLYKNLQKHSNIVDILNTKNFVEFCQSHKLTKWFVAGITWQICVHTREMGLNNFSQLRGIDFYSDHYGFLKEDGTQTGLRDFQQDKLMWSLVPEIGYQLCKDHNYIL